VTAYDAVALTDHLADSPYGQAVGAEKFVDYAKYYGLIFTDVDTRVEHQMYCLDLHLGAEQERIVVQHFIPPNAKSYAMFLHGYFDHVGLFRHVIQQLLRRGVAVVSYDQIGHGLSSGTPAVIGDFDQYVAATRLVYAHARQCFPQVQEEQWHWIGQSMGSAVVMEYLQQRDLPNRPVGEIILFAPLVRPYAWWINRWLFRAASSFLEGRPRVITENANNPKFIARQRVDPLAPQTMSMLWITAMVTWYRRFIQYPVSTLAPKVIQGDADRTVDWRYGLKTFQRRYPNHVVFVVPAGRHHLANESDQVQVSMWSFLDQHCQW